MNLGFTGQALITEAVTVDEATKSQISEFFSDSEVVTGHLETTVLPNNPAYPFKDRTCHFTKLKTLSILKELGLTHLNLAGNHAFDLGPTGINATLAGLNDLGLIAVGAGADQDSACQPALTCSGEETCAIWGRDAGPQSDLVYASFAHAPFQARPGIAGLRVERTLQVDQLGAEQLYRINRRTGYAEWAKLRAQIGYDDNPTQQRFYGIPFYQGDQCLDRYVVKESDMRDLKTRLAHTKATQHIIHLHQHHWGDDWFTSPSWALDISKSLVDAGFSVVAISGNPRVHSIYRYRRGLILSGLGGLIFHTRREASYDESVWHGQLVRIESDRDIIQRIKVMQIEVCGPPNSKRKLKAGTTQAFLFNELPTLDDQGR